MSIAIDLNRRTIKVLSGTPQRTKIALIHKMWVENPMFSKFRLPSARTGWKIETLELEGSK